MQAVADEAPDGRYNGSMLVSHSLSAPGWKTQTTRSVPSRAMA